MAQMTSDRVERPPSVASFWSGMVKSVTIFTSTRAPKTGVNFGDPHASAAWQTRELGKQWEAVGGYIRGAMIAEHRNRLSRTERG